MAMRAISRTSAAASVAAVALGVLTLAAGLSSVPFNNLIHRAGPGGSVADLLFTAAVMVAAAGVGTWLATLVHPFKTSVAVAAFTLVAAALFNPLRRRVQHVVDRRFNRARYNAEAIVAAFTARLGQTVDLDTVHGDLVSVVDEAFQRARLRVARRNRPGRRFCTRLETAAVRCAW